MTACFGRARGQKPHFLTKINDFLSAHISVKIKLCAIILCSFFRGVYALKNDTIRKSGASIYVQIRPSQDSHTIFLRKMKLCKMSNQLYITLRVIKSIEKIVSSYNKQFPIVFRVDLENSISTPRGSIRVGRPQRSKIEFSKSTLKTIGNCLLQLETILSIDFTTRKVVQNQFCSLQSVIFLGKWYVGLEEALSRHRLMRQTSVQCHFLGSILP